MKRVLTFVLAVAMLFVIVACGSTEKPAASTTEATKAVETSKSTEAPETTAPADPLKGKKIGFINAGPDDYYAQFGKTLKAVAESYGIEVTEVNSDYKPEKELANVQDMVSKGVDAIAVITAGAAGSAASIKAANDAKVPIFFIAGKPELQPGTDLTGHVTDNFVIMGYKIGQWVAKNYPTAKTVDIPGFLGQGPAEGEIVGFDLALSEAKMEPAVLLKSAEWQRTLAIPITQDLVASGRPFDVVFAANEETAAGVIQVFEEQNVKGKVIVSNNGKEEAWQWMKDGKMAATVPNPPSLNADLSVQQMIRYFKGEKFEKYLQIMPFDVLTKDNIDKAIPWNTENYMKGRAAKQFQWDLAYYEENYLKNKQMFDDFDAKVKAYMEKK